MKLSKQEQKYRVKQQLAHKFTQKPCLIFKKWISEEISEKAVSKLVNKLCK